MKQARWCSCCTTICHPTRKAARRSTFSSSSCRLRPRHCVAGRGRLAEQLARPHPVGRRLPPCDRRSAMRREPVGVRCADSR
jgi:hypothetical protein